LRMGPDRKIKQSLYDMFRDPREGDLLMDVSTKDTWRKLCQAAADREAWRDKVRLLKQKPILEKQHPNPIPTTIITAKTVHTVTTTTTTTAQNANRYKQRDAHAIMFHPQLKSKLKKKPKKRKKKQPRPMTNKERAKFAREHYETHHNQQNFSPPPIMGHHHTHCTQCSHNDTLPMTPPSLQSMFQYQQDHTQHQLNLKNLD